MFDIDGVIGPLADPPSGAYQTYLGFGMWWHPETATHLQRLHRSATLAWCTSWREVEVHDLAPLLGLPDELPHEWALEVGRWKYIERLRAKFDPSKTVWVDDRPGPGSRKWASGSPDRLLIRPAKRTGMMPEHWEQIEGFLAADQSRGAAARS